MARKPKNRKQGKAGEERWITINGAHVLVDGDGNLKGKTGRKIQATTKVSSLSSMASQMKKERSDESQVVGTQIARDKWKEGVKKRHKKRVKKNKAYAQLKKMEKIDPDSQQYKDLEKIHSKKAMRRWEENQISHKEYDRRVKELFDKHVEEGLPKMSLEEKREYAWRDQEKKRLKRLGYEEWDFPARDLVYQSEFRRMVQYARADIREAARLEKEKTQQKPKRKRKRRNSGG